MGQESSMPPYSLCFALEGGGGGGVGRRCACDGANILFDIDGVMEKKLVDVGEGMRISEPVKVDKGLKTGGGIYASPSHQGILAIYAYKDNYSVQFTNLNTNRQVEIEVETDSIIGFYDDNVLLLTLGKPLREATVEEVFDNPTVEIFKEIKGTGNVYPWTDVSLLHERRVLYYATTNCELFAFNVDTRTNTRINVGRSVRCIAPLTGIDCGVKAVFQADFGYCIYTLNMDNKVTLVDESLYGDLTVLLPSTSNPRSVNDAVFVHFIHFVKDEKEIDTSHLITFSENSIVRVYRDVFLTYDNKTESWFLVRVVVP